MTIEELLKEKIADINISGMIEDEIKDILRGQIETEIRSVVKTSIKVLIDSEIEKYMQQGININTGWGQKVEYVSFESFFKSEFKKQIEDNYTIKRTIEEFAAREIAKFIRANINDVSDAVLKGFRAKI